VERWRVAFAIVSALAALPLLAIDNVSSADPAQSGQVVAGAPAATADLDPAFAVLAARASDWGAAREARRQQGVSEAVAIAQQVVADEAARLTQSQAAAAAAARTAETARKAEAARKTDALRRAQDAAKQAAAAKSAPAGGAKVPTADGPTAAQWARLRSCESGDNYGAVSAGGRFRGAYQFDQPTWDQIAERDFPELVGLDPASAPPADQDTVARALYRLRGANPWPRCGATLR
jgi:hypothetical protein